ncbi:MAG TPA: response regulator transcription factor [Saprospiraceae bacterium]|nr:response regulator transcription factor [Saprospiraceae bacterium]
MQQLKIAVFDDNKPRRELLQILIDSTEGYTCTGAYEDCRDVLKHIASNVPDVVLMDIDMPHVNGIEGLVLIKKQFPEVKILMQTIFEDEEKIFNSIVAGADGYILKKTPPVKLLDAIKEVCEGGAPMTPSVAKQVLLLFSNKHKSIPRNDFDLTPRELEILALLVEGYSYKMIADKCNLSYSTVNSHISHIYQKLHVSSGTEAVAKALEHGTTGISRLRMIL